MRIYYLTLGQYPNSVSVRMCRMEGIDRVKWVPDDSYCPSAPMMIAFPAAIWDLLHSGLGLRKHCIRCRKCGMIEHTDGYYQDTRNRLERLRFCFDCNFWLEKSKLRRRNPNFFVAGGRAYYIDEEDSRSAFRGFGGRKHVVRFFDGRVVHTSNLWFNGEVPAHWRAFLPDTAEFVERGSDADVPLGEAFTGDESLEEATGQ